MKIALYTFTALAVIAGTIALVLSGDLHPFYARAITGLAIIFSVFIAFMPYHTKGK
jgi:hypothetical protein